MNPRPRTDSIRERVSQRRDMADNVEAGGDAQVTFKVKTSSDSTHTITMAESATVLELKTKLAGEDMENIPVERQRLIYSGRVMKNDDTLGTYKIKPNNTIHMVKSAASNPTQPASSSSAPAPQAVPTNMASGTANNPLAGLTGARFAGHQVNLPGMDMFGPDGGMGPPLDEDGVRRMMSDPNVQSAVNEAFNNPDFVNMLIQSNPMLRNMPGAREMMPFLRQVMTNPEMMDQVMQMQRMMQGGDSPFPAPGGTDSAAQGQTGATGEGNNARSQQNPFMNPFLMGGMPGGGAGGENRPNMSQMLQALNSMGANPFAPPQTAGPLAAQGQEPRAGDAAATTGGQQTGTQGGATANTTQGNQSGQQANPFAALFPPQDAASAQNPFGMNPEMMQQMMQILGGGGGAAPNAAPDNRPPEERYAEQLRQLNDMGFFDFDRNVAALRRSGGSVQGAIEHLLNALD
ncbi:deubiquitination-protection protein dph1 [Purpureocillium lavendulum]|uniref:Deubiquitination-protection protein dph1 n=1 Tax=Purpureocillium lavendulum TaxID=1247861 RepID=A0AB34FU79_9HYPO|nr:deubiquitination-protection protein dph1 [Purpureocillium lavendulum]